jgi:hypothetical protein
MAECGIPRHGRLEGVPLRFPRPAMVPTAISLAVTFVVVGSTPTLADQVRHQEWWLRTLHVTQAWRTTEGAGVTVAVLDTGTDPAQPDLAGSVLTGPDFTHSGETAASPYFYAHGTAVASLIAGHGHGQGHEAAGVLGVAPAARILSVRVTLAAGDPLLASAQIAGGLPAAIARGIRYAARQGAQVIDLPLDPAQPGANGSPGALAAGNGSGAEQAAIDYALRAGAVVVAPAGDDGAAGNAVNYPAAYPGVIAVGAFNVAFIKSPFSIRQQYVTLTAPGQGLVAAAGPRGYATLSSTSAASAVVAGVVALIRSEFPELSAAQVTEALKKGTVFRPRGKTGKGSGSGTADAERALTAAAAIAGPGAKRAGTGSLARVLPAAPPPPTYRQPLTSARLEKDGLISGALLLLLLLPIAVLAVLRRRRDGASASGAEDELGWDRYAGIEGSPGEPKLGYLAAPAPQAVHASPAPAASSHRLAAAGLRTGSRDADSRESIWGEPAGRNGSPRESIWGGAGERAAAQDDSAWWDAAQRDAARSEASWGESVASAAAQRDSVWAQSAERAPGQDDPVWGDAAERAAGQRDSVWGEPAAGDDFAGFESLARPRPNGHAGSSAIGGAPSAGAPSAGAPSAGAPSAGAPSTGVAAGAEAAGTNGRLRNAAGSPGRGGAGNSSDLGSGGLGSGGLGSGGLGSGGLGSGGLGGSGELADSGRGGSGELADSGRGGSGELAGSGRGGSSGLGSNPRGPSVFDVGQGGFSGSSSFTGLSPRAATPDRPSAAGQVPAPQLAPLTRPAASRAPKVSGSPPWEPAVKPDSELPWANVSASQVSGRGAATLPPRPPPRSVWDIASAGAGTSGSGSATQAEQNLHERAGGGNEAGDAEDDAQNYGWNPGATTETLPAVSGDED